jgi:hypothetical protein
VLSLSSAVRDIAVMIFANPVERRPKSWQASTQTLSENAFGYFTLLRVSGWRWRPREGCD